MGWSVLDADDGLGALYCTATGEAFGPIADAKALRAVAQAMHNAGRDVRECPPEELVITVHTFVTAMAMQSEGSE